MQRNTAGRLAAIEIFTAPSKNKQLQHNFRDDTLPLQLEDSALSSLFYQQTMDS